MTLPSAMDDLNRRVIQEFRANAGRVLTGRFAGSRLLLLTTCGRKSGAERVKPLMYVEDGDCFVVFASKGGAPTNPDWYYNLLADPRVVVEVGAQRFAARARVTSGQERQRIWEESLRRHPFLADIQARTTRQLPVIVLERDDAATGTA